jgi:hypothetical protein
MKNIQIIKSSLFVLAVCLLQSCTTINEVVNPDQKPIVGAYLAPGARVELSLATAIAYSETNTADSISVPIDGQTVKIKISDGRTFTLKGLGNGQYISATNELVKAGLTYTLDFTYKGLPIIATTTIPTKPVGFKLDKTEITRTKVDFSQGGPGMGGPGGPMGNQQDQTAASVIASWNNPNGDYHFLAYQNIETNPEEVQVRPNNGNTNNPRDFQRRVNNQPTTLSVTTLQPNVFQYFGRYKLILYHLNPDYAALYRSGGTTSQNISTPPTAITNGLGIFTGVNTDTLTVTVLKN